MFKSLLRLMRSALGAVLLGLLLLLAGGYLWFLTHGPEPKVWHTAHLEQEFTAAKAGQVTSIASYRQLEDRLFAELKTKVLDKVQPAERNFFNRYSSGSRSDPAVWPTNWNRTFEITPPNPTGAALLLHGLTDSPYSMRSIGQHLAARGLKVVGLRLPGHGTAPSGLLSFEVEDMQAAVRMAMRDLRRQMGPDRPIYIVGYSNGAALGVDYAVSAVEGADQPMPAGLVLLSPAIGITRLAVIARLRTGISSVPGLGRAAWQDIETEFDPYKYSSFSFHASGETQRLTSGLQRRIAKLANGAKIKGFPPVLAFQSTVDATIVAPALVHALFEYLAPESHELVLFDVNRFSGIQALLVADPGPLTQQILSMPDRSFGLTVITNAEPGHVAGQGTPGRTGFAATGFAAARPVVAGAGLLVVARRFAVSARRLAVRLRGRGADQPRAARQRSGARRKRGAGDTELGAHATAQQPVPRVHDRAHRQADVCGTGRLGGAPG